MFCIYLRTNSDLCHLQYKLVGFYNRDEKCLLRGTNWVFKYSSLRFVFQWLISVFCYVTMYSAMRFKARVSFIFMLGIAGSKPTGRGWGNGFVFECCILWSLSQRCRCRADHSYRGVLHSVLFLSMIVKSR